MASSRQSRTLRVTSLKAALDTFLSAPATGGHRTNEGVVLAVMGAAGSHEFDCPTYDAVREKYGKPKACTFDLAFNACWNGKRDWREFDLEALRESHDEFRHLQLPTRVEDAIEREAIMGEEARAVSSVVQEEEAVEYPPMELLRRAPPAAQRRRRPWKRRSRKERDKGCAGSRNACGATALAKKYQAAKKAYHAAGEQLRWAGIRGDLV